MSSTETNRVIVTQVTHTETHEVSHRDFPEIRAEGDTAIEAARNLIGQLQRALDSALTEWRRETLEKAVADVRAYVEHEGQPSV